MTDGERNCQGPTTERTTKLRAETIQILNDRFRRTLLGGKVFVTAGVNNLGPGNVQAILAKVIDFDAFGPDNDPYGEHDFGAFDYAGSKIFWKIDYYDNSFTAGSPDPSNADETCRVLTVMVAEEY